MCTLTQPDYIHYVLYSTWLDWLHSQVLHSLSAFLTVTSLCVAHSHAQALFFESPLGLGKQLKVLEVRDAKLSPWSITRLARYATVH